MYSHTHTHTSQYAYPHSHSRYADCSSSLSLDDSDLLTGLLETIVVLWEGVRERIEKPGNKQLKKKLTSTMAASMPLLFDTFKVTSV